MNFNNILCSTFCRYIIKFKSVSNIYSMFCGLILVDKSKSIISRIPRNISQLLLYLYWTYLYWILFFNQISYLNNWCKMIFFNEFFHAYCDPLTFLRNNYLTFFSVLTPCSPFSLYFIFVVVNKNFSDCRTIWIIV